MWGQCARDTMTGDNADLDLLFDAAAPAPGARALFVNAAAHRALGAWGARMDLIQPWKPFADALAGMPAQLVAVPQGPYDAVFVRLQRQRERHLADLARALEALRPGGRFAVCGPNGMGGARIADDLAAMGATGAIVSKSKCRLVVGSLAAPLGLAQWTRLDAPRPILDGRAVSAPGLFAWDRVDPGSALLLDVVPPLAGPVADLGAGWGALTTALRARQPDLAIDAYEADARALPCLERNAPGVRAIWHDVSRGLPRGGYAAIVSNLPFHDPRGEDRGLAERFARAAAAALAPGGAFHAVANRHLPYEKTLDAVFGRVERLDERDGYKAFRCSRS